MGLTAAHARIGMFGGAFDPPHIAHVALAQAAVEQLQLDELRVFPTGNAWHKANAASAAEHRLAMARIAFAATPRAVVDPREIQRAGPTYTIDTLRELRNEHPAAQLFLVMGEDQAVSLTRWREWRAVLQLATLCVAARPDAKAHADQLPEGMPAEAQCRVLHLPQMPESATEVRARVAGRQAIGHLVPPGIASYIDSHHLYEDH
jgi:nicotinate-nucleotide adenylyltransferase